jgi:hypothetical protein
LEQDKKTHRWFCVSSNSNKSAGLSSLTLASGEKN